MAKALAVTDEQGNVPIALRVPLNEFVVLVTRSGYRARQVTLEAPFPVSVQVELLPIRGIGGVVVTPNGAPVNEGVFVVAHPRMDAAQLKDLVDEVSQGKSHRLATTTDEDGRFELSSLQEGQDYVLMAGGEGMISLHHYGQTSPAEEEVVMVVAPVLGARLKFVDMHTGEDAQVSNRLWGGGTGRVRVRHGRIGVDKRQPSLALAGINLITEGEQERVYLYWDAELRGSEELTYAARFPGYDIVQADFIAKKISGVPETTEIELWPLTNCWGGVHINYNNACGQLTSASTMSGGRLKLVLTGEEDRYSFLFGEIGSDGHTVSAVPCGEYRLQIVSVADDFRFPREGEYTVLVEEGVLATVDVDLAVSGGLRVSIISGGEEYTGPARFELDSLDERLQTDHHVGLVRFHSAPYEWRALPAGPYRFQLLQPSVIDLDQGDGTGIIWVDPGFSREVEVDLWER